MPSAKRPLYSKRPTEEEEEARVAFVQELLATSQYKFQIKAALRQFVAKQRQAAGLKVEALSPPAIESYISRAREANRAVVTGQIQEKIAESVNFYETIKRNHKLNPRDRLMAQQRIDSVLGLEAPKRTEITGGGGVPLLPPAGAMAALEISYGEDARKELERMEREKALTKETK